MKIAHLLRKYNPMEWGGTETAMLHLLDELRRSGIESVVYCPNNRHQENATDPLHAAGCTIQRFRAFVPVWGLREEQREQLRAVGGNILSWDVFFRLAREKKLSLIHTHTLLRLGAIAMRVARLRRIPLVVTVHGGVSDLPSATRDSLLEPLQGGVEWGKLVGALVGSRRLLSHADAIIAVNRREARLLQEKYPRQRVACVPHGVVTSAYDRDCREHAYAHFPQLRDHKTLLALGRIEPAKNQLWLVEQAPALLSQHANLKIVLAGPIVDQKYGRALLARRHELGLEQSILLAGLLPPADPKLIGLLQTADALLLPSVSETFGLVLIEAWAARTPVIASHTHGADELVAHGKNGWLFELDKPRQFHEAVRAVLHDRPRARKMAQEGHEMVRRDFDSALSAHRIQKLYEKLLHGRTA